MSIYFLSQKKKVAEAIFKKIMTEFSQTDKRYPQI